MSEEIVRRLRSRDKKSMNFLKESLNTHRLYEADEDEDEEFEDEIENTPDEEIEDNPEDIDDFEDRPRGKDSEIEDDDYVDPEGEVEEEDTTKEEVSNEYINPLDNAYAVKYTIGDKVLLSYSNGTKSKLKGEIDGYDPEGFYRIRWSNGLTTNGITDLALADLISSKQESTCVCGSTDFVTEGKSLVCDHCGRYIRESMDPLTLADKSRPKGKKLIRSEAHPVSTAIKPSVSESIRKAFKKDKLNEDEEDYDIFYRIRSLDREFWTRLPELREDIEELGYTVDEITNEYVVISTVDEEDNDYGLYIPIIGTSRTMTLDLERARRV